jgi:phosphohistidine phosphatase SixA
VTLVYLVRHAEAKNRLGWAEPDHLRPLTEQGRLQAAALPSLLDAEHLSRLVSSPLTRCVQTLEALAEATGLPIEVAEELTERAPANGALELLYSLAETGAAVACTHGDVLLDVLDELRSHGVRLDGPLETRKGATWVLDVDGPTIRGGSYLEAPGGVPRPPSA